MMQKDCMTCKFHDVGREFEPCKSCIALCNWHISDELVKEDDQTIKADEGKLRLTLVPREIIRAIARARMYGLRKYGDAESWKSVSIERYRDALFRHLMAYLDDPHGVDEESGLSHLDHLATNVAFLCELEEEKRGE